MTDSCDFPAAHSMDTTWFAVDRDGHVAMLQSGESGAVPESVCGDELLAEAEDFEDVATGGGKLDPAASVVNRRPPHLDERMFPLRGNATVLMFLPDSADARALLEGAKGRALPATVGLAFEWSELDRERFDDVHARGLCTACDHGFRSDPAKGVYVYDHTAENWISGPYARSSVPDEPIGVAAMPVEYLAHTVRFEGRFAETEQLQPAEIWKCGSWQPGWLAMDGRTVRPFEGQEEEFEDAIENLEGEDVEVKPPITGLPQAEVVGPPAARKPAPPPLAKPTFPAQSSDAETDFSGVLDDDAKPKTASPAPEPAKKKPWWKIW